MRASRSDSDFPTSTAERILEAALVCFSRDGYEGATMRDIAAQAKVPLGLLRYHFGGKLKLWQASVDRAVRDIRGGLDEPIETASSEGGDLSALRSAIRSHVTYVGQHPEFVRLMLDEGKRRGPRMRWIVDRHVKPIFALLTPAIAHLQGLGRLPSDIEPAHFVYCLIGAIDLIFHQAEECRRVTGIDPTDSAAIESHARAVEYLLLGAPSNRSPLQN
jgi:TetR/AcrR family transcriptional regulator